MKFIVKRSSSFPSVFHIEVIGGPMIVDVPGEACYRSPYVQLGLSGEELEELLRAINEALEVKNAVHEA